MRRHLTSLSVLASIFLLTHPHPASAQNPSLFQELGGSFVAASSEIAELPSPRGFRATSFWSFGDAWLGRLSLQRLTDRVEQEGLVCRHFSPHVGCQTEPTEVTSTIKSLQGALMRVVHRGSRDRIGVGGGLSFTQLHAESIGESGLSGDLFAPNTGQVGFLGTLSVAFLPSRTLPLVLEGGFTAHWVWFHHCSGEVPRRHDPFCEGALFRELDVGLAYLF